MSKRTSKVMSSCCINVFRIKKIITDTRFYWQISLKKICMIIQLKSFSLFEIFISKQKC